MTIVRGITYRHIAGYLKVVGQTRQAAERHVRQVLASLRKLLPPGTIVKNGRYKGIDQQLHVFEVPVVLNRPGVRVILAAFALQGGLHQFSS